MKNIFKFSIIFLIFFSISCANEEKEERGNVIIIHELGDPDKIQPSNSTSANSTYIEGNIFMTLGGSESTPPFEKYGYLAENRPKITEMNDGNVKYEYHPNFMPNTVVKQSLTTGMRISFPSKIDLILSTDKEEKSETNNPTKSQNP